MYSFTTGMLGVNMKVFAMHFYLDNVTYFRMEQKKKLGQEWVMFFTINSHCIKTMYYELITSAEKVISEAE